MGLFSDRVARKSPQDLIAERDPAMLAVLGHNPSFSWQRAKPSYGDRSDMKLVVSGKIATSDALNIFEALQNLGLSEPFLRPNDGAIPKAKMKISGLQDDLAFDSHEPGGLTSIRDFKKTEAGNVLGLTISVSAETYRELIKPQIDKHATARSV